MSKVPTRTKICILNKNQASNSSILEETICQLAWYFFLKIWFMRRGKHSVENERCFSTLSFVKSKFINKFTTHLELAVKMYAQNIFTLQAFCLMLQSYLGMWRRIAHWMFSSLHLFSRFKLPWILCCVYHIATNFVCYVIILFIFWSAWIFLPQRLESMVTTVQFP
jgi:hypothetical protein